MIKNIIFQILVSSILLLSIACGSGNSSSSGSEPGTAGLYWHANASDYGYLWQYSIPALLGEEACGPTATTNAFTFLENTRFSDLGDIQLSGHDYGSWLNTAEDLADHYMDTVPSNGPQPTGTTYPNLANGMYGYAQDKGAGAIIQFDGFFFNSLEKSDLFPDWIVQQDMGPTIHQLYALLSGGAGVVMGMNQQRPDGTVAGGHIVTLAGLDWDDANGDGIVDQDEGAKLYVIDPLDPSSDYGPDDRLPQDAFLTELSVWQGYVSFPGDEQEYSMLAIEYRQYHGSRGEVPYGPYDPDDFGWTNMPSPYYLDFAASMTVAP